MDMELKIEPDSIKGFIEKKEGEALFEYALQYSKEREAFGRPINKFQAISFKLAQMAVKIETARLLGYKAAWLYDQGRPCVKEASMAKIKGSELQQHLSEFGMMMMGMHGQLESGSKYAPLEGRILHQHLMNTSLTILAGTTEIQKGIIATRGLGLPRG